MTTREMTDVMLAYERGEQIEYRLIDCNTWCDNPDPKWNWSEFEYRIKPQPKRWRAEECGRYYYIGEDGGIWFSQDVDRITDKCRFEAGNYFKSKESAQIMADKFKELLKGNMCYE